MISEDHSFVKPAESVYTYEYISSLDVVASQLQAQAMRESGSVALVTVKLHFEQDEKDTLQSSPYEQGVQQSTRYILDALRRLVRKTDYVYVLHSTCYFVLRDANLDGGKIVYTRLWDALLWRIHNMNNNEFLHLHNMSIGYAAYSQGDSDVYECIEVSHEPVQQFLAQHQERRHMVRSKRATLLKDASETFVCVNALLEGSQTRIQAEQPCIVEQELPALARKMGIPYLSFLPRRRRAQVQQLVTVELAQQLHCYPLGRERGTLTVAVSDPQNSTIVDRLHQETGLHIFPVLTPPHELQMALDQLS
jgi:hypothetical protein